MAYNRAYTVIKWLKGNKNFSKVVGNNFSLNALTDPIATVTDKSTRGLDAKLRETIRLSLPGMGGKDRLFVLFARALFRVPSFSDKLSATLAKGRGKDFVVHEKVFG